MEYLTMNSMGTPMSLRRRLRDWRVSLAFVVVIGAAIAVAGAWLAIALPLLRGGAPFRDPDRLAAVQSLRKAQRGGLAWQDMEDLRTGSLAQIAGYSPRTWGLQTEVHGHVEVVLSQQVTEEFFDVLGMHLSFGDTNQLWFSHAAWDHLLGGSRDVRGRTVWINASAYRVAGVLPAAFDFPTNGQSPDIYIPLNRTDYCCARGAGSLGVVARLKAGATREQFQRELDARSQALAAGFAATNREVRFVASDLVPFLLGDRVRLINWLLAAVATLLLIAIANAGGIWLAQWLRQQRQIAIRLCLGATAGRLVAAQAAEALCLGVAAAGFGLLGAQALLRILHASPVLTAELSRLELWSKASLDPLTMACLVCAALFASLASAMLPLIGVRTQSAGRSSGRVRIALAVAQLTLTGTLAYTGILIWRNVQGLLQMDRGFRTEQILISGIGVPEAKYDTDEKMIRFHQRAIEELSRIQGVTQAAGGTSLPVSSARTRFLLDAENVARNEQRIARIGVASPGLLPLLGIPLRRGRLFENSDRWDTPRVALVNQAFIDRYLAGIDDPTGHRLRLSFYNGFAMKPYADHIIVGVIGDTLNRDLARETEPQIVIASTQIAMEGFHYFVRSGLSAEALKKDAQRAIWNVDPEIERVGLRPLAADVERSLVSRRSIAWLVGLFGAVALLVVGFGLASSLTATFVEMTRDLGIRAALGAPPSRLVIQAVRWGAIAVAASWLFGLPLSMAVSRVLVLEGVPKSWDPASWLAASLSIGALGLLVALAPARKAATVDPASVLKVG